MKFVAADKSQTQPVSGHYVDLQFHTQCIQINDLFTSSKGCFDLLCYRWSSGLLGKK